MGLDLPLQDSIKQKESRIEKRHRVTRVFFEETKVQSSRKTVVISSGDIMDIFVFFKGLPPPFCLWRKKSFQVATWAFVCTLIEQACLCTIIEDDGDPSAFDIVNTRPLYLSFFTGYCLLAIESVYFVVVMRSTLQFLVFI